VINVNDFKTGLSIEVDGEIYSVIDFQHVKPGKGAAFVRSKLKNLRNGNLVEKTFRAGETVNRAMIENRSAQYLYNSGDGYIFMDNETFDQFELSKKQQAARKKQKQIEVKEIKFRPGTDEGDYQVKLRNVRRFLEDGDKAKITLRFRGREMAHQDIGMQVLNRIENDLQDFAIVEQRPKLEGRQMVMVLTPKKGK